MLLDPLCIMVFNLSIEKLSYRRDVVLKSMRSVTPKDASIYARGGVGGCLVKHK